VLQPAEEYVDQPPTTLAQTHLDYTNWTSAYVAPTVVVVVAAAVDVGGS
jgi:hypothetical protein